MKEPDSSVLDELLTVNDWIRWGASQFLKNGLYFGHGTDNAWDDSAQLVLWVIHTPWQRLQQVIDARLTTEERRQVLALMHERVSKRLPVPYLTGIAHFAGLQFKVNPNVLIPRSPIAELIAHAFAPWLSVEPTKILDLCTGSGCIGIACAFAFPESEVHLSDISAEAIDVAKQNVEWHQLSDQVHAVQSDLFERLAERYDLIVTNPPYVDAEDMASLPAEYLAEPKLALASGDDGLAFTRRLLREAGDHLSEQGVLIAEVGNSWPALEAAFPRVPFTWIELEQGGHGVFMLTRQELLSYQAGPE